MRAMFETEWQDIQLASVAPLSSRRLAGPDFYRAFYDAFFARYASWDDLSASWRREKERCADLVISGVRDGAKILSVGCGLGYMEHYIRTTRPSHELFIHEVTPAAWRWIRSDVAEDRMCLGMIPDCLPPDVRFDLVYLSAVDYAMTDDALVALLSGIRSRLSNGGAEGGKCLIISASFDETPATLARRARRAASRLKAIGAAALDRLGVRARGQLWGWARTRAEFHALMQRAGFRDIVDGFVSGDHRGQYWISGR
jgi:hypothetical protein